MYYTIELSPMRAVHRLLFFSSHPARACRYQVTSADSPAFLPLPDCFLSSSSFSSLSLSLDLSAVRPRDPLVSALVTV